MDGSIRFNDDINIEVAVDPTAEEGARLTGAKNLVDGQELGAGSDLPVVTSADAGKVLAVNASGEWAAEKWAEYDAVVNIIYSGGNFVSATPLKGTRDDIFSKVSTLNNYGPVVLVLFKENSEFTAALARVFDDDGVVIINVNQTSYNWLDDNTIILD